MPPTAPIAPIPPAPLQTTTLYILGGLPGSGKTTTCRGLKDQKRCFVVSSDALRLALNAGVYPRGDDYPKLEPFVWELVRIALTDLLRRGENVAVDATNLRSFRGPRRIPSIGVRGLPSPQRTRG